MANTVTTNGNVITLSALDSDYDFGKRSSWESIQFVPGAAGDILVIKDKTDAGPTLVRFVAQDTGTMVLYDIGRCWPFLDFSDCTIGAGTAANVRVILKRK
jgi:hypothetical protein